MTIRQIFGLLSTRQLTQVHECNNNISTQKLIVVKEYEYNFVGSIILS